MNLGLALSIPSEGVDPPVGTREMAFRERGLHRAIARNVHPSRPVPLLPPCCFSVRNSYSRGRSGLDPELGFTIQAVNPLANTSAVIGGIMRVRKA